MSDLDRSEAISTVPPGPPVPAPRAPYVATPISSLGGLAASSVASIDTRLLHAACISPGVLPNSSNSSGCSFILKRLLVQLGIAHQVVREVSLAPAHTTGDAIDITSTHLDTIARVLRAVPQLFTKVTYASAYPDEALYIQDGALVTDGSIASSADTSGNTMHIESTKDHLAATLVQPTLGSRLSAATSGPFANRAVFTGNPASNVVVKAHWSEWIDDSVIQLESVVSDTAYDVLAAIARSAGSNDHSVQSQLQDLLIHLRGGDGVYDPSKIDILGSAGIATAYSASSAIAIASIAEIVHNLDSSRGGAPVLQYDGLPALVGLTQGVDYDVRPDRAPGDVDQFIEYEADSPTFLHWTNYPFQARMVFDTPNADVPTGFSPFVGLRVVVTNGLVLPIEPGGDHTEGLPGSDQVLESIEVPLGTTPVNGGAPRYIGPWTDFSVDLSAIAYPKMALVFQPGILFDGVAPSSQNAATQDEAQYSIYVQFSFAENTTVSYRMPRYRYWIPDGYAHGKIPDQAARAAEPRGVIFR